MLSALFQDRSISPKPPSTDCDKQPDNGVKDLNGDSKDIDGANDRAIADVLLAADLENEMEDDGEDTFEEIFDDGRINSHETADETNKNLVPKPKRKMELKAGLLKEILLNKPKRHTFSGLYM